MKALPNSPLMMEGLIPAGEPTNDTDGTLALPTPQRSVPEASGAHMYEKRDFTELMLI